MNTPILAQCQHRWAQLSGRERQLLRLALPAAAILAFLLIGRTASHWQDTLYQQVQDKTAVLTDMRGTAAAIARLGSASVTPQQILEQARTPTDNALAWQPETRRITVAGVPFEQLLPVLAEIEQRSLSITTMTLNGNGAGQVSGYLELAGEQP